MRQAPPGIVPGLTSGGWGPGCDLVAGRRVRRTDLDGHGWVGSRRELLPKLLPRRSVGVSGTGVVDDARVAGVAVGEVLVDPGAAAAPLAVVPPLGA